MDFVKISTAPLPLTKKFDEREAFSKVIDIWKDRCHTVNRRLLGIVSVKEDKRDHILAVANIFSKDVEIRKFIPRSSNIFSSCAYEISFCLGICVVEFRPVVLDEKRHPHVSFPYRLALEETLDKQWNLSLSICNNVNGCTWMQKVAFPRLLKWFAEIDEGCTVTVSHRLVNMEDYSKFYYEIKNNWGQQIVANWTERTNPQKFVYEDCSIAAYLIAYWRRKGFVPQRFCDIGCGNGLLVHLLQKMEVNGYGIDLRRRKIWASFVGTDLREGVVNPKEDFLDDTDFFIGNHTDELTPWIPIMAARLGYCVEEDRLKIPSTKRYCFLCTVPPGGLVKNVEDVISSMIASTDLRNFVSRQVKNCSQLPREFRHMLTTKVFRHLLGLSSNKVAVRLYEGESCSLKEIADLLDKEEKAWLRDSDGGLQTFLKNQHQVFKVAKGTVAIRNWAEEGRRTVEGKMRTSDCWFYKHHPNGCPLSAEECCYKH
uniref:tRNA (uracil-O(2)-)-methyltransferase n=1 Tax=Setaria digitata TaxID=48799 RepID=A0A915PDK4_9BILA